MFIPYKLKDHPFITFLAGILIGIGIYDGGLRIFQLEIAPKLSSCPKGEVSIKFDTSPTNAKIKLADSNKTFFQGMCLSSGRHHFVISSDGHKSVDRTIHIDREDRVEFIVLPGLINIDISGTASKNYPADMERLSLNFDNIEVRAVLQMLAEFNKQNIAISPDVDGYITLKLKDVPWEEALDTILLLNGLEAHKTENVIVVAKK